MTGWIACATWAAVTWAVGAWRYVRTLASRAAFAGAEGLLRLSWWLDPAPPVVPTGGGDVADEVERLIREMEGGIYE